MCGKAIIRLIFRDEDCRERSDITFPCDQPGFKELMEKVVAESRKHVLTSAVPEKQPEFVCLECGHKFYSAQAAAAAAFEDGCPDCSSSDIEVA